MPFPSRGPTLLNTTSNNNGAQGPGNPFALLATVSLYLEDRVKGFHLSEIAHYWHLVLIVLVFAPWAIRLLRAFIDETTAGISHIPCEIDPLWGSLGRLWRSVKDTFSSLLPPRWRRKKKSDDDGSTPTSPGNSTE
jgi:hypothetical protein